MHGLIAHNTIGDEGHARIEMAPRGMTRPLLLLAMVQGLASFPMPGVHNFVLHRAPSLRSICATGRGERPLHLLRNQLNTRDTAANQRTQVRVPSCPAPAAWPGVVQRRGLGRQIFLAEVPFALWQAARLADDDAAREEYSPRPGEQAPPTFAKSAPEKRDQRMSPTQYLGALKRCGAELETLVSALPP